MKHNIKLLYQETIYSWKILCTCGWKEGAFDKNGAIARHKEHAKRPIPIRVY